MRTMGFARARVALAGLACALAPLAHGEDGPVPTYVEKIEVTGSHITRVEGESALPVTVITRQEIDRTGATTAMELLQYVSANASVGSVSLATAIGLTNGPPTFGAQTANLRGLQGGRTLVLVNGKRLNNFAGEVSGVEGQNLAVIPFSAIERVEVLRDGASAVYGSDAIAGVINFILRSDYRGAEATVWLGAPTRSGGGQQEVYSASIGLGDLSVDRYNAFFSAHYNDQHNLLQRDRDFSRGVYRPGLGLIGLSSNAFPANVTTGSIGQIAGGAACAGFPYASVFLPNINTTFCYFDPSTAPGVEGIPDTKNTNLFVSGKFQLNNSWQLYGTGLYSKEDTRVVIQPAPISNVFTYGPNNDIPATVTVSPGTPFYPTAAAIAAGVNGEALNVRYRSVLTGNRDTTDTNEGYQWVGGVKGSFDTAAIGSWDADLSYSYSSGKVKEVVNDGFPLYSRLLPLLNSGQVNLFGPNSDAIAQQVRDTNFSGETFRGSSTSQGAQGRMSGEIWQMAAGPLALALGAEYRRERIEQEYNPVLSTGDISGYGSAYQGVNASRDDTALFAELNIPLAKTLEVNLAIRTDNYSDFGRTNNPKISLRWQPGRDFLLRGSYGTGFLPPTLYELFVPQQRGLSIEGLSDPMRCPVTNDTGFDCNTQFPVLSGGNPLLQPEKSENTTLGFMWEPGSAFSTSFDYFRIHLKNIVSGGIPTGIILGDLDRYGYLVTRGPPDPVYPDLPGRITSIQEINLNIGSTHVEGWDVEAHYRWPRMAWGRLRFDISGTYYLRYDQQNLDGSYSGLIANQSTSAFAGELPRWKHYASFTWDSGPWSATLAQTYQSSYIDSRPNGDGDLRRASSMSLFDLQGQYTGYKNLTLTLGCKNIFDTNPPQTNQMALFQGGFDAEYYDARARFVYFSVRYAFK